MTGRIPSEDRAPTCYRLLVLSSLLIFWGRGYQYFFWDHPLRVLLWDETLMRPVVEVFLGISWLEFAASPAVDHFISGLGRAIGIYWVLAGIASALLLRWNNRWLRSIIAVGCSLLFLHALLETKDRFYQLPQFFEHAIQIGTGLALVGYAKGKKSPERLLIWLKVLIATTFAAHGLYALGVYPLPARFVVMTNLSLGLSEGAARQFLFVAGWLDLIVAVGIFLSKSARWCLLYAVVWGLLTALARTVTGFDVDRPLETLHQSWYQTLFRLPHGLIPLAAYSLNKARKTGVASTSWSRRGSLSGMDSSTKP